MLKSTGKKKYSPLFPVCFFFPLSVSVSASWWFWTFPSLSRLDEGGAEDGMGQFGSPGLVCCCPGRFVAGSWKNEWWKEQPLSTDECTGEDSA